MLGFPIHLALTQNPDAPAFPIQPFRGRIQKLTFLFQPLYRQNPGAGISYSPVQRLNPDTGFPIHLALGQNPDAGISTSAAHQMLVKTAGISL
jgi:hypothetical protein